MEMLFGWMLGNWLQAAKVVALFPGVISFLLAAFPRLQLTLPGVALYSVFLAVLYGGVFGQGVFQRKPPAWLIPHWLFPSRLVPIKGWNETPAYAIALTITVLLMYALRSRSGLRSDQAFFKRPGSTFLFGLFTFSLTAMTALLAAMLLQWFLDHVWHGRDDMFTALLGAYATWIFVCALTLRRDPRLEPKHWLAASVGCVLSFPAVFGQFFWLQFAWKWNF